MKQRNVTGMTTVVIMDKCHVPDPVLPCLSDSSTKMICVLTVHEVRSYTATLLVLIDLIRVVPYSNLEPSRKLRIDLCSLDLLHELVHDEAICTSPLERKLCLRHTTGCFLQPRHSLTSSHYNLSYALPHDRSEPTGCTEPVPLSEELLVPFEYFQIDVVRA